MKEVGCVRLDSKLSQDSVSKMVAMEGMHGGLGMWRWEVGA